MGWRALKKTFLWASDLPRGGFPKEFCTDRDIQEVANVLYNANLLTRKKSRSELKYALGAKSIIQPILDSKSFPDELLNLAATTLTGVRGRCPYDCCRTTRIEAEPSRMAADFNVLMTRLKVSIVPTRQSWPLARRLVHLHRRRGTIV